MKGQVQKMIKKEVAELKKRFGKDTHNIDRVSGCYVNDCSAF